MELKSKVAIVTGAGQGLGKGIARRFARAGATVVCADIREETAEASAAEIRSEFGVDAWARPTDVGNEEQARGLVEDAAARFGRLDILVNAAQGYTALRKFEEKTNEMLEYSLRTGLYATMWTMQAAMPHMRKLKNGRIINFCSLNGISGELLFADYNATKEAIRGLTRTAAREWGPYGIRCNCIAPAGLSPGHIAYEAANPEFARKLRQAIPLGYVGDPEEDIGGVALCLASEAGRFLNGMTMYADGGLHLSPLPPLDVVMSKELDYNPAHDHAPEAVRT